MTALTTTRDLVYRFPLTDRSRAVIDTILLKMARMKKEIPVAVEELGASIFLVFTVWHGPVEMSKTWEEFCE